MRRVLFLLAVIILLAVPGVIYAADIYSAICSESFYETYAGDKTRFSTRRYDSAVAWEAARRGNLAAAGNREIGVILEGFQETLSSPLIFSRSNWTVDDYHYPVLTAEGAARAGYAWDDNAYRMVGNFSGSGCLHTELQMFLLDGIQMYNQSTNNAWNCTVFYTLSGQDGHARIKNCWLRGGGRSGIYNYTGGLEVDQCVVLDSCGSNTNYGGITVQNALFPVKINNSVIISNSARGIYNRTANEVLVNNTYVHVKNNNLGCFAAGSTGGFILHNSASSDGTADDFSGENNLVNVPFTTDTFEDVTTPDLRHKTTGSLHLGGLNLSEPKTFDVSSVISRAADVVTGCVLELVNESTQATVRYYDFASSGQTEYSSLATTITLSGAFSGDTQKIGIISDLHYPESDTDVGYARDGLNALGCGMVLVLGDCASDTNYDELMTLVHTGNTMVWHFLAGNHDVYDASATDNQGFEYYTGDSREYYIDVGNCRIYMLGVAGSESDGRYQLHADAVTMLGTLSDAYNNIICTHLPMPETVRASADHERKWHLLNYNNIYKAIVGKSIVAWFCGHTHSKSFIPAPDIYAISSEADELSTDIEGVSRGSDWSIGLFNIPEVGGKWNTITPAKWNGIDWSDLKWNGM